MVEADFVIPSAARNLLFACSDAAGEQQVPSFSLRKWSE